MAPGGMGRRNVLSRIRRPALRHPGWRRDRFDISVGMATRRYVGRPARCGLCSSGAWPDPAVGPSPRDSPEVHPASLAVDHLRLARFGDVLYPPGKPVVPDWA